MQKGKVGFLAVGLCAGLLFLAACGNTGEGANQSLLEGDSRRQADIRGSERSQANEDESSGGEDKGPMQLLFSDPRGYGRSEEQKEVTYTRGEGDPEAKIIVSGDNGDAAVTQMVEDAVKGGDHSLITRVLEEMLLEGEVSRIQAGGYGGLLVVGEPVRENLKAIADGAAYLAMFPVEEQLIVVEGYASPGYREEFITDFHSFLANARAVRSDTARERDLGEVPGAGESSGEPEESGEPDEGQRVAAAEAGDTEETEEE